MTDDARREVFEALLEEAERARAFPDVHAFRMRFEGQRDVIDALVREGALESAGGKPAYVPTLQGLRTYGSPLATAMRRNAADLLAVLQDIYRRESNTDLPVEILAERSGLDVWTVQRGLAALCLPIWRARSLGQDGGTTTSIALAESVLDFEPSDVLGVPELARQAPDAPVALRRIEIYGYRPFRDFEAELGDLTVIIGANAAGKSALLDFLRFLREATHEPLPPEIDRQSIGKSLFHAGQRPRLGCTLSVDMGIEQQLRYAVEIHGPVGAPRVVREQLALAGLAHPGDREPFRFLDFSAGKGMLRDPVKGGMTPAPWSAPPNELVLRRMIDPRYTAAYRLREAMSTWRVYAGFDVSAASPMRQPVITEPAPILAEDGHNLSAVLLWLQTEHPDLWSELETHLRSVLPNFRALQAKLMGGRGQTLTVWREEGVADELTLADLSDGTLRFLCWLTLCLAPRPASLVCMDEPEIGLHPRVLPLLAGLCKRASEHTQVLLTTHSPYFLAQFDLDDIAIMRREGGQAVFARPGSSAALRDMIAEVGGDELMRMHISDELETLA
jgi:predicted ATPase